MVVHMTAGVSFLTISCHLVLRSCRGLDWLLVWVLGSSGGAGRMKEGLKCLTSVNMNVLGKNTMKFAEGSTAAALAVGFFSSESHWDCLWSWSRGNAVTPAMWMILVAPNCLLSS